MASPQKEHGYTAIANELLEALARIRIAGMTRQVIDVVFRKTYGFNKKEDRISLSQFVLATNISKRNVIRAIQQAVAVGVIVKKDTPQGSVFRINKDFEEWRQVSKLTRGVSKSVKNRVSKLTHTKDIITKDINTAASPQTKKMKKNRMGSYSEDRASDSHEEVVDLETGEVAKPKERAGVLPAYKELVEWAEKRRGFKFISVPKQYKAFKEARTFGLDPLRDLKPRWVKMQDDPFYKDKGFDWATVVYSFNRKGK